MAGVSYQDEAGSVIWLKRAAKRALPQAVLPWCARMWRDHLLTKRRFSYAESGEDLLLALLIGPHQRRGFYVDVGAYHPKRMSNTYYFYRRGWQGINIEPRPGAKRLFDRYRPRDINLECGVAEQAGMRTYHLFDEAELNGFSRGVSESRIQSGRFHPLGQRETPVLPLRRILNERLPAGTRIDFLSVDAEDLDLEVLLSNDWSTYRPRFVLVEIKVSLEEIPNSEIYSLLKDQGYRLQGKTLKTAVFDCADGEGTP